MVATSFVMCTSGAILSKAGANVSTATLFESTSGARLKQASEEAEALINTITRNNYSDDFSGLNADVQGILQGAASDLGAADMINWDMSGYTSRAEAQTMQDVLRDKALRNLSLIKDKKQQDFIDGA